MSLRWLLGRPVALGFAATVLLIEVGAAVLGGVTLAPVLHPRTLPAIVSAAPQDGMLLLAPIALVLRPNPFGGIAAALAIAVLGATVERMLLPRRFVVALLVTGAAGAAAQLVGEATGLLTPIGAHHVPSVALDPFTPLIGSVLTASAFAGPFWRRRIRLVGLAGLLVGLLYFGGAHDLSRLAAAVTGLLLGVALRQARPTPDVRRNPRHDARALIASAVGATAAGPLLATLAPHGHGPLHGMGALAHLPNGCGFELSCGPTGGLVHISGIALSLLPLIVLAVAALGLWRGRRAAAVTAVLVEGLLAFFAVTSLLPASNQDTGSAPGPSSTEAMLSVIVPLAVALIVAVNHRRFAVQADVRATSRAIVLCGRVIGASIVTYLLGGWLVRGQFTESPTIVDLLLDLPERLMPVGFLEYRRLDFVPVGPAAQLLWSLIGPLTWVSVLVALIVCLSTVRAGSPDRDAARARALLRSGSSSTVSAMILWPGNRFWFTDDGAHLVGYRVIGSVALTLGPPAGPKQGAIAAGREFADFCTEQGLDPVFYSVSPQFGRTLGAEHGWRSATIGEDAVIDLSSFSMTGKRWADVRSSINRAARVGIRAEWTTWQQCSSSRRDQIASISEDWVAERGLPEMGFTLGGLEELKDPDTSLMLAINAADEVEAVTSWLPTWQDGRLIGWTLDVMRRRDDAMNGVTEFLIASVALSAQQQGLQFVSLSAAPLTVTGRDPAARSGIDRVLAGVARVLEPTYGFASLAAFKRKFGPRHDRLVLTYPGTAALPAVAVAVARAYLPNLSPRIVFSVLGSGLHASSNPPQKTGRTS